MWVSSFDSGPVPPQSSGLQLGLGYLKLKKAIVGVEHVWSEAVLFSWPQIFSEPCMSPSLQRVGKIYVLGNSCHVLGRILNS